MANRKARVTRRVWNRYREILTEAEQGKSWVRCNGWLPQGWNQDPTLYKKSFCDEHIAWAAYGFAKEWQGRSDIDLKRLQNIVIRHEAPIVAYYFARDIQGANIKRLQRIVINGANPDLMRRFAELPGAYRQYCLNMADVAEVMVSF